MGNKITSRHQHEVLTVANINIMIFQHVMMFSLVKDSSPTEGVLPTVYRIKKLKKWPRSNKRTIHRATDRQRQMMFSLLDM
jgi:hypothetical protein